MVTPKMTKENKTEKDIPFLDNRYLPSYFVDAFRVSARKDDIAVLSFYSDLPNGIVEQTRVITPVDRLKALVDLICRQIDYYPEKDEKKEMPKKKK